MAPWSVNPGGSHKWKITVVIDSRNPNLSPLVKVRNCLLTHTRLKFGEGQSINFEILEINSVSLIFRRSIEDLVALKYFLQTKFHLKVQD